MGTKEKLEAKNDLKLLSRFLEARLSKADRRLLSDMAKSFRQKPGVEEMGAIEIVGEFVKEFDSGG